MNTDPSLQVSDRALIEYLELAHGIELARLKHDLAKLIASRTTTETHSPHSVAFESVKFRVKGRSVTACEPLDVEGVAK